MIAAGRRTLALLFGPLWERFRLGEGGLLGVNAAIIGFRGDTLESGAARLMLSGLLLAALYSFNDLRDAEADRSNPRKNQLLVGTLIRHRREFHATLGLTQAALALAAYALLGSATALAVLSLVAVNTLYSMRLKGVPVADVCIVGVWGGCFSAVAAPAWELCVLVGIMTAIMQVFQMLVDRDVDAGNRVRTTAVASRRAATGVLAAACLALVLWLADEWRSPWALTALLPLALHLALGSTQAVWMLSRVYLAVLLIAVLGGFHGYS